MKHLLFSVALLAAAGCGKKDDKAAPPAGDKKVAEASKPAEAPKPEAPAIKIPGGIPECDAVLATHKKFQACAKIAEADRVVQDSNVGQLTGIGQAFVDAAPDAKDNMKTGLVSMCKDQDATLQKLIAGAGC